MRELHIRTTRTARCHALGRAGADTREVWIVCHGYGQLARYFLRPFTAIDDGARFIIAPEALSRYYADRPAGTSAAAARVAATWMTREDREHEIADYIEYLDNVAVHALAGVAPDVKVTALGFSQGAATVSRWAARGSTAIDHVVLWGAGLPPELVPGPALFRGAALTIAVGSADAHAGEAWVVQEDARLRAAGMEHRLLRYDGGHRIDAAALHRLVDSRLTPQ